jgi:hypothetical protein
MSLQQTYQHTTIRNVLGDEFVDLMLIGFHHIKEASTYIPIWSELPEDIKKAVEERRAIHMWTGEDDHERPDMDQTKSRALFHYLNGRPGVKVFLLEKDVFQDIVICMDNTELMNELYDICKVACAVAKAELYVQRLAERYK